MPYNLTSRMPRFPSLVYALTVYALTCALLAFLRPALPIDETRYLTVAWEMRQAGSWLIPLLNGEAYSDKPPLLFWLINLAWSVFGTGDTVSRAVAPVLGAGGVLLTAMLAARLWPARNDAAGLSAWVFATTGIVVMFGSLTMFDALLTTTTVAALLGVVIARNGRWWPWCLAGVAAGLGVLAKGPVLLLHVLPATLAMPLWMNPDRRPPLGRWYAGCGMLVVVMLAVVGAWLVPVAIVGSRDYLAEILWHQHAGRVVNSFAHQQPAWFYLAVLPLLLWPWAMSSRVLPRWRRLFDGRDEGVRFLAAWVIPAFALFSLVAGKQPQYLLPELPAFSMLVAWLLTAEPADGARRATARFPWMLIAPALLVGGFAIALGSGLLTDGLGQAIQVSLSWLAGAIGLLVLLGFVYRRASNYPLALGLVAPASLVALHLVLCPALFEEYDPEPLAAELRNYDDAGIAAFNTLIHGQLTWAGRLSHPVEVVPDNRSLADWARGHPCGAVVIGDAKRPDVWPAPRLREISRFSLRRHAFGVYRVESGECAGRPTRISSRDRHTSVTQAPARASGSRD